MVETGNQAALAAAPADAVVWEQVSMTYPNGHQALSEFSLRVAQGEVLALLGSSGSGKTTALKMVNALVNPTSGQVLVHGRPTQSWDPIALRRSMGYVIQEGGLMPHLSVLENVALAARIQGRPRSQQRSLAKAHLELVGLDPARFGPLFPRQLSGGQRQRVGVARALTASESLILMDEPFGALDPVTRRELQSEFRGLQKRLGTTVILVTHDIREACRLSDRLALLHQGRLLQTGTWSEIVRHPANEFVRRFFEETAAIDPGNEVSP